MKQEKLIYTEPIFEIEFLEYEVDILTLSGDECLGTIDSEDFGNMFGSGN